MNLVLVDVMAAEVSDCFHGVGFSSDLYFVAFHGLLDSSANIADADIGTGSLISVSNYLCWKYNAQGNQTYPDTSVRCILDRSK